MRLGAMGFVLVLLHCLPIIAGEDAWHPEFDAAQAESERLGKDLLIVFGGSDWCVPCKLLKNHILNQPGFVEPAGKEFVLVDIDDLKRTPMPQGRKERYENLQRRYGIEAFPTVVLATPQGVAYAQTTYFKSISDPAGYWKHLQPFHRRGQEFRLALEQAANLQGAARAGAELADALALIHPEFVVKFHGELLKELATLAPGDVTGYLAFIEARSAVAALQRQVRDQGLATVNVEAVNELIREKKLRGEALQDALVVRALCEVKADRPGDALASLGEMLEAQKTRSGFDRGDFVPLDDKQIDAIRAEIARGRKGAGDRVAEYYALHRIFQFELPDRLEICCGPAFRAKLVASAEVGDQYGKALMDATASLQGEARARALGHGLEGTRFLRTGAIRDIIDRLMPQLVGAKQAKEYLPKPYGAWVPRE